MLYRVEFAERGKFMTWQYKFLKWSSLAFMIFSVIMAVSGIICFLFFKNMDILNHLEDIEGGGADAVWEGILIVLAYMFAVVFKWSAGFYLMINIVGVVLIIVAWCAYFISHNTAVALSTGITGFCLIYFTYYLIWAYLLFAIIFKVSLFWAEIYYFVSTSVSSVCFTVLIVSFIMNAVAQNHRKKLSAMPYGY